MVLWHHCYIEIKWSSLYLNYNSRYTALTTLGIRQEAEQIMANVFYPTFLNVFFNFLERFFYIYAFFLHCFDVCRCWSAKIGYQWRCACPRWLVLISTKSCVLVLGSQALVFVLGPEIKSSAIIPMTLVKFYLLFTTNLLPTVWTQSWKDVVHYLAVVIPKLVMIVIARSSLSYVTLVWYS